MARAITYTGVRADTTRSDHLWFSFWSYANDRGRLHVQIWKRWCWHFTPSMTSMEKNREKGGGGGKNAVSHTQGASLCILLLSFDLSSLFVCPYTDNQNQDEYILWCNRTQICRTIYIGWWLFWNQTVNLLKLLCINDRLRIFRRNM